MCCSKELLLVLSLLLIPAAWPQWCFVEAYYLIFVSFFLQSEPTQKEKNNKIMKELTTKRATLVRKEEASFKRDLPKHDEFRRDIPLWNKHIASEMLEKHVGEEMAGKVKRIKPLEFWRSKKKYHDISSVDVSQARLSRAIKTTCSLFLATQAQPKCQEAV